MHEIPPDVVLEMAGEHNTFQPSPHQFITREEASNIALAAAKEAARQTLNETFGMLGVNLANFDDMQKFRDDLTWVRRYRSLSDGAGRRAAMTIISVVSAGVAISLWEWIKSLIRASH